MQYTLLPMNLPLLRAETGKVPTTLNGGTPWLNCMLCSVEPWTVGVTLAGDSNQSVGTLPMAVFCYDCLTSFLLKFPSSPRTGGPWKLHPLHRWVEKHLHPSQRDTYSSLIARREKRVGKDCLHCFGRTSHRAHKKCSREREILNQEKNHPRD